MAYLKQDDLFKSIIKYAIKDRNSFIDCLCDSDPMINTTRDFVKRMTEISDYTFKSALKIDKECVRMACIYAEMWHDGVADAHGSGRELKSAKSMHGQVKRLRLRFFGITKIESMMLQSVPVEVKEIFSNLPCSNKT